MIDPNFSDSPTPLTIDELAAVSAGVIGYGPVICNGPSPRPHPGPHDGAPPVPPGGRIP